MIHSLEMRWSLFELAFVFLFHCCLWSSSIIKPHVMEVASTQPHFVVFLVLEATSRHGYLQFHCNEIFCPQLSSLDLPWLSRRVQHCFVLIYFTRLWLFCQVKKLAVWGDDAWPLLIILPSPVRTRSAVHGWGGGVSWRSAFVEHTQRITGIASST
jgi:hypothetical protein